MPELKRRMAERAPGAATARRTRYDPGMNEQVTPASDWTDESTLGANYWDHVEAMLARYDRALERAGAAHAVVFSGAAKTKFLDDNNYPFQANPHFVAWLPLTANPGCYLVNTPGETPVLIFHQPRDYWHAAPAAPSGYWTSYFDIRIVHDPDEVATHLPAEREKCILLGEIDNDAHAFGIERVNPASALNILDFARSTKTAYELECMRAASRRAVAGHRAAEAAFRDGDSEFGIHLAYCAAVGQTDTELPYGNIVALNEHGAILHYQHQSRTRPADSRSFLIDAGASVNGYAADITRTYSRNGGLFADLIVRMDEMQQDLTNALKPGVDYKEMQAQTHRQIAALLVDVGLARGSAEALMSSGVTTAFFPHGLGHFLGLQVHDVGGFLADETGTTIDRPPDHPFLRLTRELEADHVLTVEPGLYIIDLLLDDLEGTPGADMIDRGTIDALRPYGGIRVEDNVRITGDGCENLTRDAFAGK